MTFIFFLGILTVFLPLGLGAAFLAQLFQRFHNQIFTAGGIFLFALGISLLLGKKFHLPFSVNVPFGSKPASVYVLGLFSGVATTCCAPVLAGVIAISAVNGTVIGGVIYTLAYVLGMVLPLFAIALLLDKVNLTQKLTGLKQIELSLLRRSWKISLTDLVSGGIFVLMGGYITYLAFNNRLYQHSGYQMEMNLTMSQWTQRINSWVGFVPGEVWSALIVLLFLGLAAFSLKQLRKSKTYDSRQ